MHKSNRCRVRREGDAGDDSEIPEIIVEVAVVIWPGSQVGRQAQVDGLHTVPQAY